MVSTKTLLRVKAEGKVVLAMTAGFSSLGNFPIGFSELRRMTGLSDPALAQALRRLLRKGLIERTRQGKYRLREEGKEELVAALRPLYSDYLLEKAKVIAEELAAFSEVEAVLLLGSAAWGGASPGSDLDLLVVLKRCDGALEREISGAISTLSVQFGIPVSPSFLSARGARKHRRTHVTLGVPLLDKSGQYHPAGRTSRRGARHVDSKRVAIFLRTADQHLRDAESAFGRGVFYDCVYHSVGAAENAADALILWLGGAAPHARGDAEAVEHLARRVKPELLKARYFKRLMKKMKELQRHAVKPKYPVEIGGGAFLPPAEFYGRGDARRLFGEARWVVKSVKRLLGAG